MGKWQETGDFNYLFIVLKDVLFLKLVGGVGLVRESQNIWRKKDHGMLKGIPSWEFSLLLWGRERLEACGGHKIGREEMCR